MKKSIATLAITAFVSKLAEIHFGQTSLVFWGVVVVGSGVAAYLLKK